MARTLLIALVLAGVAAAPAAAADLATPQKKEIAMRLVSSAENSSLKWREQYRYLEVFLDERVVEMRKEAAHEDVSRIETAQRRFLREGNLELSLPLRWAVYGDNFGILR